ncbi:hypothetical protein HWV62_20057 [Athelia sp. TMB]|nr:hypothetical protein HWV62_20057 [Athelia sp. TMB]
MADSATRNLLQSMVGKRPQVPEAGDSSSNCSHSPIDNYPIDGWGVFEATQNTRLNQSAEQEGVALIAQSLLDRLDDLSGNESNNERSDSEGEDIPEVVVPGAFGSMDADPDGPPQKCSRNMQNDNPTDPTAKWYPWRDKIVSQLIDTLSESQRQLDLFLWLLKVNGVDDVPSVRSMQTLNATLQSMAGVESIKHKGSLGHTYYMNSLSEIIAQEMANPKVRPHLRFYPEDTGKSRSEARQSDCWLHDAANDEITPMARIGTPGAHQDYYIHEPALLRDGTVCMPVRWFAVGELLFAKCWRMEAMSTDYGEGWRVIECEGFTVTQHQFLKAFPQLCEDSEKYGMPHPSRLFGMCLNILVTAVKRANGRKIVRRASDRPQS